MPRPMQHPHQAPRGTACNVACGTLLPPSTSRKHAPVTAGHRYIRDLATKLPGAAGAWASRRARRGRVSAADVGAPRAAQPERASRAAMLLPEGDEHRLQRLELGQFLPAHDLDDRLPLPLVAGKGRRVGAAPGSVFTRRRHAARVPGPACALPSPSGPPPAHHAALRRAGLMAPEAVGRQCP